MTSKDDPIIGVGNIKSEEKGSGARFNTGKPAMELIPAWIIADYEEHVLNDTMNTMMPYEKREALDILINLGSFQKGDLTAADVMMGFSHSPWHDCAAVFEYGRKKYAAWNWAKGMNWSIPIACIIRHCLAILKGEINDPESGLPHRGHIACNIVMLIQYQQTYPEGDDRPKKWLAIDIM